MEEDLHVLFGAASFNRRDYRRNSVHSLILIVSLAFAAFEILVLGLTYGPRAAFSAVLGGVALQMGYLAGIYGRSGYERAGISWRAFRMRRVRPDV